jgi:acyl carrier protein
MDDTHARLVKCFAIVFPDLSPTDIPNASVTSVAGWDSIAMVTLLAVIEEEFEVQIDPADFEAIVSFDSAQNYLRKNTVHS